MSPNQRKPDETKAQYRERLKAQRDIVKHRTRMLWPSSQKGTYVARRDGPLH